MTDVTVRFGLLVSMFQAMLRDRSAAKKRKRFRTFLDRVYTGREYFSAVRLILPALDRERGTYGLKEATLASCLIDALGLAKDSPDALRLLNWRKGGAARAGANAGNFALVAAEVLQRRQGLASGGLTIKELNDALDQLSSTENRGEKASVLSGLINRTNALEMKWILMIILKDLKLGISEKSIFHEFHPDAEDLFNVTCDLKLVCEKLKDRNQRQKKQDIEVGKPVRPQLATRVSNAANAWKKLHGKEVVVECKFDGDRIQIHKNGDKTHFFSRNFLDHTEYAPGMSNVILGNIMADRCILDGEMLVWDTSAQRFAEFGSNQEIAKAAREGFESHRQHEGSADNWGKYRWVDCLSFEGRLVCIDVAFDILYVGDTSVIHQSLKERHQLLRNVVKPLKGHLEILIPNEGLNVHRPPGEPCWSIVAYSAEDVERFFKDTIENRDEGIVLKDLGSKWEPGDRSGKWLKLKPDYVHAGSDLDVLIIGGYFGSGRRGGEVAQFLVGLAERSDSTSHPKRFISFCRVGTGLSDEELDALVSKLKPYFRKNEHPKKVPRFYEVTNNSKERPDVWIDSPDKSVILSITSDIRTVKSEVFASPYSLRFPRIHRVRYDKPWYECLDVQAFMELVHSSNGNTQKGTDHGDPHNNDPKRAKSKKKGEKTDISVVPAHLIQTNMSGVKEETLIFSNMIFYFVNVPPTYSVDYFHKIVAKNGGSFSMNLNDAVTHCIAAEKKGIKYQAAVLHGDIIHYSWVLDCCKQKLLLHLQPKYFLFLAETSKKKFQGEIDAFADYYFWDIDVTDLKQIFSSMAGSEDTNTIDYYNKKYCPAETFCMFQGCYLYFHQEMPLINTDCKIVSELTLRRLRLEVSMHGGQACDILSNATHLLVISFAEEHNFDELYKSFPTAQRHLLHYKKLHVVRHQWLEDSLESAKKMPEDAYNLKPDELEEIEAETRIDDIGASSCISAVENQTFATSLSKHENRKRGRYAERSTPKAKVGPRPVRRTRARIENKSVKVDRDESEDNDSSDEIGQSEDLDLRKNSNIKYKDVKVKAGSRPVRRTHARTGKKPAIVDRDESEYKDSSNIIGESQALDLSKNNDVKYEDFKDHEPLEHNVAIKNLVEPLEAHLSESYSKQGGPQDNLDESSETRHVESDKTGTSEKLEQIVDPLNAILLDMIPSLSQRAERKVESGNSSFEARKPQPNDDGNAVKKKVSYKDVAGQLLKDW